MPVELLAGVLLLAANSAAADTTVPSTELLEFLGSFTTDNGEWVDPQTLAEIDPDTIDNVQSQTESQTENQTEAQPGNDEPRNEDTATRDPNADNDEGNDT